MDTPITDNNYKSEFKVAVTKKDPIRLNQLAFYHVTTNVKTAKRCFKIVLDIDKKNVDATYGLALCYNENDVDKADIYFKRAAKLNHTDAIYTLALKSTDEEKSLKLLTKATNLGHLNACFDLANRYYQLGSISDALEYYQKAALLNHGPSLNALGIYYLHRNELDKAIEYLLKSFDAGCISCLHYLGDYYVKTLDYDNAEKYYLLGVEHDETHAICCNALGVFYMNNAKNCLKCKEYLLKAIETNGNIRPMACANLGQYYMTIEKNESLAFEYLSNAVKQNNPYAMTLLGKFYMSKKQYQNGKKYLQMAVDLNYPDAMCSMADYYVSCDNIYEALNYLSIAMDLNYVPAMLYAAKLHLALKGAYHNAEGKKAYLLAIKQGSVKAMNELGDYWFQRRNYIKAETYYNMALQQCEPAMKTGLVCKLNNIKQRAIQKLDFN